MAISDSFAHPSGDGLREDKDEKEKRESGVGEAHSENHPAIPLLLILLLLLLLLLLRLLLLHSRVGFAIVGVAGEAPTAAATSTASR